MKTFVLSFFIVTQNGKCANLRPREFPEIAFARKLYRAKISDFTVRRRHQFTLNKAKYGNKMAVTGEIKINSSCLLGKGTSVVVKILLEAVGTFLGNQSGEYSMFSDYKTEITMSLLIMLNVLFTNPWPLFRCSPSHFN